VPLVCGGADDLLREVVDPFLDLLLIFAQVQRELSHPTCPWSCSDPMSYRSVTKPTNPSGNLPRKWWLWSPIPRQEAQAGRTSVPAGVSSTTEPAAQI